MSGTSFSAIITTLGQRDLGPVLDSLRRQTFPVGEIIVVQQGDETPAVAAQPDAKVPLKWLRSAERGASRGRNAGIRLASGSHLFFPDDDCRYAEDFCERAREEIGSGYDVVTGRSLAESGAADTKISRFIEDGAAIDMSNVLYTAIEFTIVVERKLAQEHLFDPRLGVGSGTAAGSDEAVDFMARLLKAGARARYSPRLRAYHPDPVAERRPGLHRRGRQYSRGRGYILRHHRLPAAVVARELLRPLGGFMLNLLRGDWFMARYYFNVFAGKIEGCFIVLHAA